MGHQLWNIVYIDNTFAGFRATSFRVCLRAWPRSRTSRSWTPVTTSSSHSPPASLGWRNWSPFCSRTTRSRPYPVTRQRSRSRSSTSIKIRCVGTFDCHSSAVSFMQCESRFQISSIPSSLASCPRLKTLRLEENCIALDEVPRELLADSKVRRLIQQVLQLTGHSILMFRYG